MEFIIKDSIFGRDPNVPDVVKVALKGLTQVDGSLQGRTDGMLELDMWPEIKELVKLYMVDSHDFNSRNMTLYHLKHMVLWQTMGKNVTPFEVSIRDTNLQAELNL